MNRSTDPNDPTRKMGNPAQTARKNKNRERFLTALRQDPSSIKRACETVGIQPGTYSAWRGRDHVFRAQVDAVRGLALPDQVPNYDGGFVSFRKTFFGYDTYFHMALIVNAIENSPAGGITLILVPPEFGKTTLLEDYCNYRIARTPNVRITVVSEGQPHARKIMRRIQARCTDNAKGGDYIARFGPFHANGQEKRGKPWAADFFTVYKADHDERDYTMEARGWRSAVAGTRTDLLLVDDIQSSRSLSMTAKMVEYFRQDFLTRVSKEGATVIVGTRVGVGDFYEAIQDAMLVDEVIELPAVNPDGGSLCPELWPDKALTDKRRKVGEDVWWRNYMQAPKRGGTQTFTEEMTNGAKDISRTILQVRHSVAKVAGLDPALTGNNAIVVAGYDSKHFELLDARSESHLGSTENILAQVDYMATVHRFDDLIVESNAFQKGLVHDERLRDLAKTHGFRVRDHTTHANKLDQDIGVARMPSSFVLNEISIPWGDTHTQATMEPLLEELHNWRPRVSGTRLRQDLVMAMWFCWLHWQMMKPNPSGTMSKLSRPRLPWQPSRLAGVGR